MVQGFSGSPGPGAARDTPHNFRVLKSQAAMPSAHAKKKSFHSLISYHDRHVDRKACSQLRGSGRSAGGQSVAASGEKQKMIDADGRYCAPRARLVIPEG